MRWSYNLERSQGVALWLFAIAGLVFAMVVLGGATRLTGSGLSITEWKPVSGVIPPLTGHGWTKAFEAYQRIPQYRLVNRGMTLGQFKFIFWWEWTHRLLGRLLGLVAIGGLAFFLWRRRFPRRLIWRCWVLVGLGALQGLVGWWMVSSGLEARVAVAPERLATHLGLALFLYGFAVWTGMEAWSGRARPMFALPPRWAAWASALVAMVYCQMLLGALVAGDHAGSVYTDWPLMDGRIFPAGYVRHGLGETLLHSQAAVQFNHRIGAYVVLLATVGFAVAAVRGRGLSPSVKRTAMMLATAVVVQACLGILTLRLAAPLGLSLLHQIWAVGVLTIALSLAWRIRRN